MGARRGRSEGRHWPGGARGAGRGGGGGRGAAGAGRARGAEPAGGGGARGPMELENIVANTVLLKAREGERSWHRSCLGPAGPERGARPGRSLPGHGGLGGSGERGGGGPGWARALGSPGRGCARSGSGLAASPVRIARSAPRLARSSGCSGSSGAGRGQLWVPQEKTKKKFLSAR